MSSRNCPIWRTTRRPKQSQGIAAKRDPAKPPIYKDAVMRPSMEEEGLSMADVWDVSMAFKAGSLSRSGERGLTFKPWFHRLERACYDLVVS